MMGAPRVPLGLSFPTPFNSCLAHWARLRGLNIYGRALPLTISASFPFSPLWRLGTRSSPHPDTVPFSPNLLRFRLFSPNPPPPPALVNRLFPKPPGNFSCARWCRTIPLPPFLPCCLPSDDSKPLLAFLYFGFWLTGSLFHAPQPVNLKCSVRLLLFAVLPLCGYGRLRCAVTWRSGLKPFLRVAVFPFRTNQFAPLQFCHLLLRGQERQNPFKGFSSDLSPLAIVFPITILAGVSFLTPRGSYFTSGRHPPGQSPVRVNRTPQHRSKATCVLECCPYLSRFPLAF